ncbi:MAG: hypothetical protein MJE77_40620 [Proteobacteria bacterium]|nr:hypothetical protein [Pseudomonadota bacterium]
MNTYESEFEDNLEVARSLLAQSEDASALLEASDFVNRALAIQSDSASAWLVKAQVHSALDDDFAALAAVEMALHYHSTMAEAHYWRAAVLADLERYDEALAAIDEAFVRLGCTGGVDDDWLLEDLYYEKALIEDGLGQLERAAATFREGLQKCPNSPALKALERETMRAKLKVIPGGRAW